jgi:hypothetical protein
MTAKKTICAICLVAPRDPALKNAHCRPCNRKVCREYQRKIRGTKPEQFRAALDDQGTRPYPLGTCHDCGGPVHANGRCKEHLLAYQRDQARRKRGEKIPKPVALPKQVKAVPKPKPAPPVKPRPVVPDVPIEIGPQVFAKPAPVAGKAQRIAYVCADDIAREAEMAAWFRRRGL